MRRHRLIERFLTDVFDIPWDQVHEEAERLEHWMSPVVEERMLRAIGDAKTCPHGHPIFEGEREQGVPLADVEEGAKVRVLRFENEAEDLLHYLKDTGLHPGLEGTLASIDDDEVVLDAGGDTHADHAQRRRDGLGGGRSLAARPRPPFPISSCSARSATAVEPQVGRGRTAGQQVVVEEGREQRRHRRRDRRRQIVPTSAQIASPVLLAIEAKGAASRNAGSAAAMLMRITEPERAPPEAAARPRWRRTRACHPRAFSITTACGTKNQPHER